MRTLRENGFIRQRNYDRTWRQPTCPDATMALANTGNVQAPKLLLYPFEE